MTLQNLAHQRLQAQHLSTPLAGSAAEVVASLGAVQAQDFANAKWAIAQRLKTATDAQIEQDFNQGRILRTHVLRPTWHFVTPQDIRWLLQLSKPRQTAMNTHYFRKLGLSELQLGRCNDVIAKALQNHNYLTRTELNIALVEAGIKINDPLVFTFIAFYAELDGLVCSGPKKGKQQTFALLDERVPPVAEIPDEQAFAKLADLYFTSRGPATVADFAWWSGQTATAAAKAVETNKELLSEEIGGKTYWFTKQSAPAPQQTGLQLLPNYDEYLVAYADRSHAVNPTVVKPSGSRTNILDYPIIVLNGQVVGTWQRTIKKDVVAVQTQLFTDLTNDQQNDLTAHLQKYANFLDLDLAR